MIDEVFGDEVFFIAGIDPSDQYHSRAFLYQHNYRRLVTSQFVLMEVLNAFARRDRRFREKAAQLVITLQARPEAHVIPCTNELFREALQIYLARPDKDWSPTDCSSFLIMQELGTNAALTADRHFVQAGLDALLLR